MTMSVTVLQISVMLSFAMPMNTLATHLDLLLHLLLTGMKINKEPYLDFKKINKTILIFQEN